MARIHHRLAAAYRSLGHLHGAGIGWPEAVEKATAGDPRFDGVANALRGGEPVVTAFTGVLPPIDIAAIRAGEASGNLEKTLMTLSDRHEQEAALERDRSAATAYPIFVAHIAALLMPIPDLVQQNYGSAILWAALPLVPLYAWFAYRSAAKRVLESLPAGARPPPWSRLLWSRASVEEADARSIRALGWLHDAGVPLLEAVPLASHAGAGGRASEDLVGGYAAVKAGRALSDGWARLPPDIAAPLRTGEETGHLASACEHEADALDGVASLRRARAAAMLKPVTIILIGAVVGARVISFYYGIYSKLLR